MNEYKNAAQIVISDGKETIGVIIQVSIDREITDDEKFLIAGKANAIAGELRKNTLNSDPEVIAQVQEEKVKLLKCFSIPIYVRSIPNEYYRGAPNPWYQITTSIGHIKIGWRKRVIYIDWTDSDIDLDAETLFPKEDVTREGKSIHAWGYEKAKEYISKLMEYKSTV